MCITRANRTATASEQMRLATDERKMRPVVNRAEDAEDTEEKSYSIPLFNEARVLGGVERSTGRD